MVDVRFTGEEKFVLLSAFKYHGIDIPLSFKKDGIISSDYLKLISRVEIKGCSLDNLNFLRLLPNLEELVIKSDFDYNMVSAYSEYSSLYFNRILDYSAISDLTSLRKLTIENEMGITGLDFRNLTFLNDLKIINNPNFKSIRGLNNLHYLQDVEMYGNHITEFEKLDDYMLHTLAAHTNFIDLSAFFAYVKNPSDVEKLYNLHLRCLSNLKFSEKNGQIKYFLSDIPTLLTLYKKMYAYFKREKVFEKSNDEQVDFIFNYIVNNIKFAEEELQERQNLFSNVIKEGYGSKIPDFYVRYFGYVHNSYNTYYYKKGNCEGMVNLMKFMASILGVDSEDVHCSDRRGTSSSLNHAIFRTQYNGVASYFDPAFMVNEKNRLKKQRFRNMSFDNAFDYLSLSRFERDVAYYSYANKILGFNPNSDGDEIARFYNWLNSRGSSDLDLEDDSFREFITSNFGDELTETFDSGDGNILKLKKASEGGKNNV